MNFIVDTDEAHAIVNQLLDAVSPGRYLVMSHPTTEVHGDAVEASMRRWNENGAAQVHEFCGVGRKP